jgi:hypothetical protein
MEDAAFSYKLAPVWNADARGWSPSGAISAMDTEASDNGHVMPACEMDGCGGAKPM